MGILSKRRSGSVIRDEDRVERNTHLLMQQDANSVKCINVEQSGMITRLIDAIIAQARQEYVKMGSVEHFNYDLTDDQQELFKDEVTKTYVLERIKAGIPRVKSAEYYPGGRIGLPYGRPRSAMPVSKPRVFIAFKEPQR